MKRQQTPISEEEKRELSEFMSRKIRSDADAQEEKLRQAREARVSAEEIARKEKATTASVEKEETEWEKESRLLEEDGADLRPPESVIIGPRTDWETRR